MKKKFCFIIAILAIISSVAYAQTSMRPGFYINTSSSSVTVYMLYIADQNSDGSYNVEACRNRNGDVMWTAIGKVEGRYFNLYMNGYRVHSLTINSDRSLTWQGQQFNLGNR